MFLTHTSAEDNYGIMWSIVIEIDEGKINSLFERAEKTYGTFVRKCTILPVIFVYEIHSLFLLNK